MLKRVKSAPRPSAQAASLALGFEYLHVPLSRRHKAALATKSRWMYSYEFPPAQLGDFMLGVAVAALALRATTDAPAPGEEAPLNAPVKDGAKSQRAKAWGGVLGARAVGWPSCGRRCTERGVSYRAAAACGRIAPHGVGPLA